MTISLGQSGATTHTMVCRGTANVWSGSEWFRYQVARTWRKWLARRRCLNWDRMNDVLRLYPLPSVKIMRSWHLS